MPYRTLAERSIPGSHRARARKPPFCSVEFRNNTTSDEMDIGEAQETNAIQMLLLLI